MIRRYHVALWLYQDISAPAIGTDIAKQLSCHKDRHNIHDLYAVTVVGDDGVVGHVPLAILCAISVACYLFITRGGQMFSTCEISGSWRHSTNLAPSRRFVTSL